MNIWLRSLVFNVLAYGWTFFLCFVLLWTLLLPYRALIALVHMWLSHIAWLERNVAGLHYKVIGWENVPKGACIVACKHQSAWETFKLHLLFSDPAIVLKKELLDVPLWGWYAKRTGMIPIDRKGRMKALTLMMEAAHAAADKGRKIVIFPQGTRLLPGVWQPYKSGVAALYKELNLPLVPMALNSGMFWPRKSFLKRPGTVTVEFLPPIPPGLTRADMMERLKESLETATNRLVMEEGGPKTVWAAEK